MNRVLFISLLLSFLNGCKERDKFLDSNYVLTKIDSFKGKKASELYNYKYNPSRKKWQNSFLFFFSF